MPAGGGAPSGSTGPGFTPEPASCICKTATQLRRHPWANAAAAPPLPASLHPALRHIPRHRLLPCLANQGGAMQMESGCGEPGCTTGPGACAWCKRRHPETDSDRSTSHQPTPCAAPVYLPVIAASTLLASPCPCTQTSTFPLNTHPGHAHAVHTRGQDGKQGAVKQAVAQSLRKHLHTSATEDVSKRRLSPCVPHPATALATCHPLDYCAQCQHPLNLCG
jgi:hypothetical protein